MWSLATILTRCNSQDASCFMQYSPLDNAFTISTDCSGDLDMAWKYFREMYLQKKRDIMAAILRDATVSFDLGLVALNHHLNFYDPTLVSVNGLPGDLQTGHDSLNSYISQNCESYAQQWMSDLGGCYSSNDLAIIIPQLVQVCKEGGDIDHLMGASTVKPGSTNTYKSFEEVLKAYDASRYNSKCNVYLISGPAPFDQQPVYTNKPVFKKPDDCECATISDLYNKYQAVNKDTSFAAYVLRTTGTKMSQNDLDVLRMACNGQINCNYLSAPVYLPPVLQCGVKDVCVDCKQVDSLFTNYKKQFPDALPRVDGTDSLQQTSNRLFEQFMNTNLGFGKTTTEYLSFMDACNIKHTSDCSDDSLGIILNHFNAIYKNNSMHTPGGQYHGDTTDQGIYGDNYPVSLAESIQNGIFTFPPRIQSNQGPFTYYYVKPLRIPDNGLSIEIRMKMPLLDSTNCNYPDFQFQLRPQGGWVNALFYNKSVSCGKTSGRFDLADSTHPGHIITTQPQMAIDMSDWVKIKMTIRDHKYQIYVADTFLMEVPYTGTITQLNRFSLFYGTYVNVTKAVPAVDYIRVYNGCDELMMNQEFNSVTDTVCPDLSLRVAPDDYKTAFTSYYNQIRGTNFTSAQIDAIYANSCNGLQLNVCNNVNCDLLKEVVNEYKRVRLADSSRFLLEQIVPDSLFTYSRSDVYKNGYAHIPDQYVKSIGYGSYYEKHDTICTGNVFTVAFRVKRPARDAGRYSAIHFQIHFNDDYNLENIDPHFYVMGLSATAADSANIAANNNGMIGYGREGNYTPPTNHFIADFSDWVEVKITHGNDNIFRVYYNDVFVSERYVAMPVTRIISLRSIFQGKANNGYVDYYKVYDQNNKLQYVEDFEDARQSPSNDPDAFKCTDSCQAKFTRFYNQYTHSSQTYAQIQQAYSNCGQTPEGCSYGNNADSLMSWYNTYKRYGHTPNLDASGADTTNWKVDFGGWNYTAGVPLGEVIKNGVMALPKYYADTLSHGTVSFDHVKDTFCFDSAGFTWETRLKLPDSVITPNGYGASWWLWLYSENNPGTIQMAISNQNGRGVAVCTHANDPKKSCADVNVPGVHMNDWRVVKFVFRGRDFKYYIDDTLQAQRTLDAPMTKLYTWSVTGFSKRGQVDYIRIYKPDSTMIYDEEFNDAQNLATHNEESRCSKCGERFASYFNQRNGSELSVSAIDSIYYAALNFHISDCYEPSLTLCGKSEPVFTPAPWEQRTPCADSTLFGTSTGVLIQEAYSDSLLNSFTDRYLAKCLSARYHENFTLYQEISEYHYTLYYYDQAGNLEKTIPPAGVDVSKLGWARAWSDSVTIARRNKQKLIPNHGLPTQYRYNTLNQVVAQHSPDGKLSEFWYDRLGRLVISQNARQKAASGSEDARLYSYTKYDSLGRITEVGQVSNTAANGAMTEVVSRNQPILNNWLDALQNRRGQITNTVYDLPYPGFDGVADPRQIITQKNLRNRVSYTTITDTGTSNAFNQGTIYTYDILGNVDYLLQDYGHEGYKPNVMNKRGNRWKKIGYQYDLISGKVNMVMYQQGWSDGLYHRYSYDAENRLTLAETSRDSLIWEKDARYEYYRHGPLARVTLGDQQVQGIDYAYTLQGWLKGINSTGGTDNFDMGGDGHNGSLAQYTARDAFGLTLNYFGNDYAAINGQPFPNYSGFLGAYRPLYNGNISSSSVYQKKFDYANSPGGPLIFYNYKYDQLNRLTAQDTYNGFSRDQNKWDNMNPMGESAKERVAYDANGNIQKYLRKSIEGGVMDSLNYHYYDSTNRLKFITDNVPANGYDGGPDHLITDIDGQADSNYVYDSIGNLIADKAENITDIKWNVYGKIQEITRTATASVPTTNIKYSYDATGNRISQEVTSGGTKHYTWYVRDAQGNIMSTYTADGNATDLASLQLNQGEKFLYGSSRLGLISVKESVDGGPDNLQTYYDGRAFAFGRGSKQYELTNHLGNVLATISDKKFGVTSGGSSLIDHYEPDIITAQDYYPFGMMSRVALQHTDKPYKFGFNGKMNDNDVKGGYGLQQDYGMRIYDGRVGRFLSVDPLTKEYPWYTPYSFAGNKPIYALDLDGAEELPNTSQFQYDGSGWDYLKWVPNAAGNLWNGLVVSTWNSGVATYKSVKRGSYISDVKNEATQVGHGIKQYVSNSIDHANDPIGKQFSLAWNTVKDPKSWETAATFYLGSKIPLPGVGKKGNLLKPTTVFMEAPPAVHVALGKDIGTRLADFSEEVGAAYFRNWQEKLGISPFNSFEEQFAEVTQKVISSGGRIHFELADVSMVGARRIAGKNFYEAIKIQRGTEWELNKILTDNALKSNTDFYLNGVKQTADQLKKIGIQ
jgi:RHS repeat-associated protein